MKLLSLIALSFLFSNRVSAQNLKDTAATKVLLDSINRLLDRAVVKKEISTLQTYYADDFYFLHATGKIDNKTSWIRSAGNPANQMLSREPDSVRVELHDDVAVLTGVLSVRFPPNTRAGYAVRYLRVYALRNKTWQMLSHHSTGQWTLNN